MRQPIHLIIVCTMFAAALSGCRSSDGAGSAPLIVENYAGPTPDGARLRLGRGAFDDVVLSEDGKLMALGSHLGVYLYETDTMSERWFYPTTSKMRSIAISPDDRWIAAGELGSPVIHILNTRTGELVAELERHDLGICDLEFSPDSRLLASASYDDQVILWDTRSWHPARTVQGDQSGTNGLAFSPDGKLLAYVADSGLISIVDVADGSVVHDFTTEEHLPYGAAWSPDGALLVTGAVETALFWDVSEGTLVDTLDGFAERVERLDFSPDGTLLLIGSQGDAGVLYDMQSQQIVERFEGHVVDFSADGSRYVTGSFDNTLTVSRTDTREPLVIYHGHNDDIVNMDWLPDGSLIASTHIAGVQQWQIDEGDMQPLFDTPPWTFFLNVSADGEHIAAGSHTYFGLYDRSSGDSMWHLNTEADEQITTALISPSGTVAAVGFNNRVDLYDGLTGEPIGSLDAPAYDLVFVDDAHLLIGGRGSVALWDIEAAEPIYQTSMHDGLLKVLAIASDTDLGASLGQDDRITVWTVSDGAVLHTFAIGLESPSRMTISPDGRWLAVGGNTGKMAVLDAQTGAGVALYQGHVTPVTDLLFAPDSTRLISSAIDGTLVVWDLPD